MAQHKRENKKTPVCEILKLLINSYGAQLKVRWDTFAYELVEYANVHSGSDKTISRKTIMRWQSPKAKINLNEANRGLLSSFFGRINRNIKPFWFSVNTVKEFSLLISDHDQKRQAISIEFPFEIYTQLEIDRMAKEFLGTWLMYHNSFFDDGNVCTSIVQFFENDGRIYLKIKLTTQLSTTPLDDQRVFRTVEGKIVPVGREYFGIGIENHESQKSSIFILLAQENVVEKLNRKRFGTITRSDRAYDNPASTPFFICRSKLQLPSESIPRGVIENLVKIQNRNDFLSQFSLEDRETITACLDGSRSALLSVRTQTLNQMMLNVTHPNWEN